MSRIDFEMKRINIRASCEVANNWKFGLAKSLRRKTATLLMMKIFYSSTVLFILYVRTGEKEWKKYNTFIFEVVKEQHVLCTHCTAQNLLVRRILHLNARGALRHSKASSRHIVRSQVCRLDHCRATTS